MDPFLSLFFVLIKEPPVFSDEKTETKGRSVKRMLNGSLVTVPVRGALYMSRTEECLETIDKRECKILKITERTLNFLSRVKS